MVSILEVAYWNMYFIGHFTYLDSNFTEINFLNGLINKKPALFHIMAWLRKGNKALSETVIAFSTYAYMRHLVSLI